MLQTPFFKFLVLTHRTGPFTILKMDDFGRVDEQLGPPNSALSFRSEVGKSQAQRGKYLAARERRAEHFRTG